jgi:hypothetical protein
MNEAVCEFGYLIIFFAWARVDCERGVLAWGPGAEGDCHCLDRKQTSVAPGPYNQNQGVSRV